KLDRESRGCADGDEDRAAGDGGLLDELEGQAAADAEQRAGERKHPGEERGADRLVERVVTADVLAKQEQVALGGEEPGCVQPARLGEGGLTLAQPPGQRGDERGRNARVALDARRLDGDRPERSLPADAARRAGVEAAPQPLGIEGGRL